MEVSRTKNIDCPKDKQSSGKASVGEALHKFMQICSEIELDDEDQEDNEE
jgi:hypothetical protein